MTPHSRLAQQPYITQVAPRTTSSFSFKSTCSCQSTTRAAMNFGLLSSTYVLCKSSTDPGFQSNHPPSCACKVFLLQALHNRSQPTGTSLSLTLALWLASQALCWPSHPFPCPCRFLCFPHIHDSPPGLPHPTPIDYSGPGMPPEHQPPATEMLISHNRSWCG